MARPTIVHVITRLIVGGAQLTTIEICRDLSDEFDLRLITGPELGPEGSLVDLAEAATTLQVLPEIRRSIIPTSDLSAVLALRRALRAIDPDIVHTHSSKAGVIGRLAARGTRAKLVHTVHGWGHTPDDSPLKRSMLVGVERAMARSTSVLVAVSEDTRAEGMRQGIGRASQYAVIPEHVSVSAVHEDFATARQQARDTLGLTAPQVVGWVGRFAPQKDPLALISVLERVLNEVPGAEAVLIGDGPMRGEVEAAIAARPQLAGRIQLTGLRHDARALFCAFDVVLHPSRWEGQPRVVQEALAERVPVVASAAAGVRSLIEDGVSGAAVEIGDVDGMADAAVRILNTPSLAAPLSDAARSRLFASAGAERSIDGHRDLYRQLLARR